MRSRDWMGTAAAAVLVASVGAAPARAQEDGERRYLLERIDDAAVVQLYADGFEGAAAAREDLPVRPGQGAYVGHPAEPRPSEGEA